VRRAAGAAQFAAIGVGAISRHSGASSKIANGNQNEEQLGRSAD